MLASLAPHLALTLRRYSLATVVAYMGYIQDNAELAVRSMLKEFVRTTGSSVASAVEYMDDGTPIALKVSIDASTGDAEFDFAGTGPQTIGNRNAPVAITHSAVIYALRCMSATDVPLNQGCLASINISIPANSILNPSPGAAVVGGNVTTSQRLVDVILKAFGACAASQGCMNNLTFGNADFGYYVRASARKARARERKEGASEARARAKRVQRGRERTERKEGASMLEEGVSFCGSGQLSEPASCLLQKQAHSASAKKMCLSAEAGS
jgi:N-methylhydantoinase B/oxoprolinase/acetone carboxylase alpha subunit